MKKKDDRPEEATEVLKPPEEIAGEKNALMPGNMEGLSPEEARRLINEREKIPIELQIITWTDDGKPLMMFGTQTDISDAKRAEKNRVEAEQLERKRTKELSDLVHELQLFNQLSVDRELRMIELKKQINELRLRLGEPPLFDIQELEPKTQNPGNKV
jgi:hypothetical protein